MPPASARKSPPDSPARSAGGLLRVYDTLSLTRLDEPRHAVTQPRHPPSIPANSVASSHAHPHQAWRSTEDVVRRMLAHHAEQKRQAAERRSPAPAPGYLPATLDVLFGKGVR